MVIVKKIVLVFGLLFVLLSLCIFEVSFTHNVYSGLMTDAYILNEYIDFINQGVDDNEDKTVTTPHTIGIADNMLFNWQRHKRWMLSFMHHTVVFELDKAIIRLHTLVHIDMYEDCKVECATVKNLCFELLQYNKFSVQNIF